MECNVWYLIALRVTFKSHPKNTDFCKKISTFVYMIKFVRKGFKIVLNYKNGKINSFCGCVSTDVIV